MADYLAPATIGGVGYLAPLSVPGYSGSVFPPIPEPSAAPILAIYSPLVGNLNVTGPLI